MSKEEKALARKGLAEVAAKSYTDGHTLEQVAEEMGFSYGKAHALVKEGGATIRPRGARFVAPVATGDDAAIEDATG